MSGGNPRHKAGFKRGGPIAVVTNPGVTKCVEIPRLMYLPEQYSFTTPQQGAGSAGFNRDISRGGTDGQRARRFENAGRSTATHSGPRAAGAAMGVLPVLPLGMKVPYHSEWVTP